MVNSVDCSSSPYLSIVIPLYNEEGLVGQLTDRLAKVIDGLSLSVEVIIVDDGSHDCTFEQLKIAASRCSWLRILKLSRNFGHQAALSAGIERASSDRILLMDGDLQDPPELIPMLLAEHHAGAEVVYVKRATRDGNPFLVGAYRLFYQILAKLSSIDLPVDAGDFCLIGPQASRAIRAMPETVRFLRGLRAWCGFKQVAIEVHRPQRIHGETKYTFAKLLRLAADGIFSFSLLPLRCATVVGIVMLSFSTLLVLYWMYVRFFQAGLPSGFLAGIALFTGISGVHFFLLGIVGEYVGRIHEEVKRRPMYVVEYDGLSPNCRPTNTMPSSGLS